MDIDRPALSLLSLQMLRRVHGHWLLVVISTRNLTSSINSHHHQGHSTTTSRLLRHSSPDPTVYPRLVLGERVTGMEQNIGVAVAKGVVDDLWQVHDSHSLLRTVEVAYWS
jgi:hypothetical protein